MGFKHYTNTVLPDSWTVSFDRIPTEADKANATKRIQKGWDNVVSEVGGQAGLKLQKLDVDAAFAALIKEKSHAVMFELKLTDSELALEGEVGNTSWKLGRVAVPSDLEDYRNFLANLNGWSQGDHDLVPDSDFAKFNKDNPKAPVKPPKYKDVDEMAKKSKSDFDAFHTWAKAQSKWSKATNDYDKTARLKPADPARAAATKAFNEALEAYYKSF